MATDKTVRELWQAILFYGEFDRMPVLHWTGWPETKERWYREGLPREVGEHRFFNAAPLWCAVGVDLNLRPAFTEETVEETAEYRVFRAADGVVQQAWKGRSSIPHFIDFTLKTAADWLEYRRRLQPDPARIPADLDDRIRQAAASNLPILVPTASMMGWIRNWMGVVNMSYLMYDEPDCYADMVHTLAELVCWGLDQVMPRMQALGVQPDLGFGWEDICGKTGPLVSPTIFERCVAHGYRRIRERLDHYGIRLSTGWTPTAWSNPSRRTGWTRASTCSSPWEPGTWGAAPEHFRRRFGRELRIIGGYDKLALEKGPAAIDAEIDRHLDLMREGGCDPARPPDHPDTSLENYRYYLERIRTLRF